MKGKSEMFKAVNMKNYKFGELKNITMVGFGIINEETGEWFKVPGTNKPWVVSTKKTAQSMIDAGWCK